MSLSGTTGAGFSFALRVAGFCADFSAGDLEVSSVGGSNESPAEKIVATGGGTLSPIFIKLIILFVSEILPMALKLLKTLQSKAQTFVESHVEYINREKAFEKRCGCSFHSHRFPNWSHDDPQKFFQAADKYEDKGNRRYMEIEFALPNELSYSARVITLHTLSMLFKVKFSLKLYLMITKIFSRPAKFTILFKKIIREL